MIKMKAFFVVLTVAIFAVGCQKNQGRAYNLNITKLIKTIEEVKPHVLRGIEMAIPLASSQVDSGKMRRAIDDLAAALDALQDAKIVLHSLANAGAQNNLADVLESLHDSAQVLMNFLAEQKQLKPEIRAAVDLLMAGFQAITADCEINPIFDSEIPPLGPETDYAALRLKWLRLAGLGSE